MPCQKWVGGRSLNRQTDPDTGKPIPFTGCRRHCLHESNIFEYKWARQADEERVERNAGSREQHPTEYADELARDPMVTLKDWLVGGRGKQQEEARQMTLEQSEEDAA